MQVNAHATEDFDPILSPPLGDSWIRQIDELKDYLEHGDRVFDPPCCLAYRHHRIQDTAGSLLATHGQTTNCVGNESGTVGGNYNMLLPTSQISYLRDLHWHNVSQGYLQSPTHAASLSFGADNAIGRHLRDRMAVVEATST